MSATAEIKTLTDLPKEIVAEVKAQATPATSSGIVSQAVGFAVGIPVSLMYDWLYDLMASKVITNEIARDILKVAMPLGIAVAVHIAKIPFGNYIAGTGYAVALISLGKIVYTRVKVMLGAIGAEKGDVAMPVANGIEIIGVNSDWGVQ